jgi:hypothetical protein
MLGWLLIFAFSAVLFGLPSALILRPYGRTLPGFLIGTLLGPIGVIAALVDRRYRRVLAEQEREQPPQE